jgi:hypothetical protein
MITSVKLRAPKRIVSWRYANCRFLASGRQFGNNPESHKLSGQVLVNAAGSTGRRNTCAKFTRRSLKS